MPRRKQIFEAESQELFAVLEKDERTFINNKSRTVTFDASLYSRVINALPSDWIRPVQFSAHRYRFHGVEFTEKYENYVTITRDERNAAKQFTTPPLPLPEPTPAHAPFKFETVRLPRPHEHPVLSFTFSDGKKIEMCPTCSVPFTTQIELPLNKIDDHRRAALCG